MSEWKLLLIISCSKFRLVDKIILFFWTFKIIEIQKCEFNPIFN